MSVINLSCQVLQVTCLNIFQLHRLEIRQYFGIYHMFLSCVCSRFETSLTVLQILHANVFKGYVTVDATSVQKISFPLLSFFLCLEAFLFLLFLCTVPINIIELTEPAPSIIIFEYVRQKTRLRPRQRRLHFD